MSKITLAVFDNEAYAQSAISQLEAAGYDPRDISIVMKDSTRAREVATDTGASVAGGAVGGATLGGALGALAGLAVGTGVIPGLGAFLIGGPVAAALGLAGVAATTLSGAVTGALGGTLIGALAGALGISEDEAAVYEQSLQRGAILVAIPNVDSVANVADILESNNAQQVRTLSTTRDYTVSEEYETRPSGAYSPSFASETKKTKK